jgi:hypothetical protein
VIATTIETSPPHVGSFLRETMSSIDEHQQRMGVVCYVVQVVLAVVLESTVDGSA